MASKYLVSAVLVVGFIGNVQADNAAINNPQLTSTTISATSHISMPVDTLKASTLRSADVEENLKRTEQQLHVELTQTLADIVNDALAAN